MTQKTRSVTSDISELLRNRERFFETFEEEANFCAGACQIHTHSPTCVKYSVRGNGKHQDLCRFKAPWKLVEKTGFTEDGVLQIRRQHSMVNRYNKAMAVGLRHNHDISFIGTQRKTMALVYYLTNYTTKVEESASKRAAVAAEIFRAMNPGAGEQSSQDIGRIQNIDDRESSGTGYGKENKTRQFLMRIANRIFTERPLSQVEVIASLLDYGTEFTSNEHWTFLNVSFLYWHIFRKWNYLRVASGMMESDSPIEDRVLFEEGGRRITFIEAYGHRGRLLQELSLYDYMCIVKLKRKSKRGACVDEVEFDGACTFSDVWTQQLRKPGQYAMVSLDGYLSMDFNEANEDCPARYVEQAKTPYQVI